MRQHDITDSRLDKNEQAHHGLQQEVSEMKGDIKAINVKIGNIDNTTNKIHDLLVKTFEAAR